jgi:hypothetical protein
MPVLTIGDKSVTVDDSFLALSPAEQDAAVADIAKSIGASAVAEKPAAAPVTANEVVRATATGVPVVGGLLNQANAVTNAALAPVLNPLFEEKDQLKGKTFAERRRESLRQQEAMDKRFAEEHPVIDTAANIAGGVAGTIPAMMAAPAAFGLTGPLSQMVTRGAASNAALAAADAAVRGHDVVPAATVGGVVGAGAPLVGRAVGKLWDGIRAARNPAVPVAQNVETVAGVDIPLTSGQAAADPVKQAEEEIMRRGARGSSAEAVARKADEEAQKALAEASESIARSLDPAGTSARTAPQAAGQVVQAELAAQEAARAAAEAAQVSRVAAEGDTLARNLGGGAAPASPFDAAERAGAAVTRARDAKVAATREAYKARDAVAGTFDESVPRSMSEEIRARAAQGDPSERVHIDRTNESTAAKALKIIDNTLFENLIVPEAERAAAAPARSATIVPAKATEDETVAALRAKFGDDVADAYARQNAPPPLSLIEFIASKGGLKPDAELDAIGLNHGHRAQIPGQKGFFGTVRKNGADIDRMREAAEEAGYLRGANGATSTPAQFLDAIDAELRGQKLYPAGHEGFKGKKQTAAAQTREAAESDRINAGFEADLDAAGHGELNPDLKQRAVAIMREEGVAADDAVEMAFRQAEQEDAAGAARAALSDFPGDRPAAAAAAPGPKAVDLRAMDEARKQLVTMFGDAKSLALRTGDKSDMRAMGRILHEFDNVIRDALRSGKFTGDAKLADELQTAARKSHAEYRQTFSSRGPDDKIGRSVEKILGRYEDTAATPEDILKLSYGPKSNPGTGDSVKVGLRLKKILGENSPEFAEWKSGALKYVDDDTLSPAKRAKRIDDFLQTSWGKAILTPNERASMSAYSRNLRAIEPKAGASNELEKAVARIAGADGHLPATPLEVADMLYSRTGKGDKGISQRLAAHLKANLAPESFTAVRQGMWEKLTNAGEGKIPFGEQALSQRLHAFLNEEGRGLAEILFTKAERAEMAKLASVYKKMIPAKGTTNPSGSATIGAKIAAKAVQNLGAMIGFGTSGIPGAIAGHALQRGGEMVKDARAAKEAVRLFYGPQAKRAPRHSNIPVLLAPAIPAAQR